MLTVNHKLDFHPNFAKLYFVFFQNSMENTKMSLLQEFNFILIAIH